MTLNCLPNIRIIHIMKFKHLTRLGSTTCRRYTHQACSLTNHSTTNNINFISLNKNQIFSTRSRIQTCNVSMMPPPKKRRRSDDQANRSMWMTLLIVVVGGSFGILLMKNFKYKKEKSRDDKMVKSYGKPALGGDFELINTDGKLFSNKDLIGKWALIYFGFTHCPDICPEELEKLGYAVDVVNRENKTLGYKLQPVFISIDPDRDTPDAVKSYLSDFHSDFIGLTGTKDQIDTASKAFRVYYSRGPEDKEGDYIMDHTVVMYLLDSEGEFTEYYNQTKSAGEIASSIGAKMLQMYMENKNKINKDN